VLGMTPSGVLCRIIGAKNVLSIGLLGNAAVMALLPLVVARGVYPTSALLVVKGLCQSCLESTHTTLKRCWMPRCLGPERVWAVRVTRWGQFLGQMAASLITPWVASRFGWRAVPLAFGCATGVYTLIWHAAAAETPTQWRGKMSVVEKQLLLESDEMNVAAAATGIGFTSQQAGGGRFPFHLLKYPSCVVPMMLHVGNNCSQYTLQYWGPTMLNDMFAANPQQQGNIIFAATLASVIGSFAVAGFENLMLVRQILRSSPRRASLLFSRLSRTFIKPSSAWCRDGLVCRYSLFGVVVARSVACCSLPACSVLAWLAAHYKRSSPTHCTICFSA
jgi:MFS family permease